MKLNLKEKDLLEPNHYPIKTIFNLISDSTFMSTIISLSQGVGFGVDYGVCIFADDLDEYDKATIGIFDGVQFGLHSGEEIIIGFRTFYYYLKQACSSYVQRIPQDKETIDKILRDVEKKFLTKNYEQCD